MRRGRLHARLDRLVPPSRLGRIVVIPPEDWLAEGHVAYDEASVA